MPLIYTYDAEMNEIIIPSVEISPGTFTLTHTISLRAPAPYVPPTAERMAANAIIDAKAALRAKRSEAAKKAWAKRRMESGLWLD
jgi:hypothetical protein